MARRIKDAFAGGKAFIAFITAGDPNLAATEEYILEMERAGADLIEIGIMLQPEAVRAVSAVAVLPDAEGAGAGTFICQVEIEIIPDNIRNSHSFSHFVHLHLNYLYPLH